MIPFVRHFKHSRMGRGADVGMEIVGLEEVERALRMLPAAAAKKAIRQALRIGGKMVLAQAKQNVPVASGALKKSLKVRAGKRTRKNVISIRVATADDWFKGDTFYGAFIEFGTVRIKAQHYVQRAYDQKKVAVSAMLRRTILANIDILVRAARTK